MMDLTASLLADALHDRYVVEGELGRGGMATVYLARDLKHERPVALKVLHSALAQTLGPERFLREIQLTAKLQHPHILPVFDSGETAGQLWYTMPYVEGETLRARLRRQGPLAVGEALRITREAAQALHYAHEHGVVHRDVKPENLLLTQDGNTLVADFGIARPLGTGDERLTATGLSVGTPAYMSPEQVSADPALDARSDVYSLGCVLYEMLAGEPPFTGPTAQAVIAKRLVGPVPHLQAVRDVPVALERVVSRALARTPADRFATMAEFAEALTRVPADPFGAAGELTEGARGIAPTLTPPPARQRSPTRVLLMIGAALVALALLMVLPGIRVPTGRAALDPNLVVVAPFDVLDRRLEPWREGLVDLVSAHLDGAGPLRTVSPTVAIHRSRERADPSGAQALARRTGARFAVFGRAVGAGPDSARVIFEILDAARGAVLGGPIELRDLVSRIDRASDSISVAVLRELNRVRPIGAVQRAGILSTSMPALHAFLRGEQFFRRAQWDSAMAYCQRAVGFDSTFAPAWRRMSGVRGCNRQGGAGDSLARAYGLRAGALNRGLPPRDSLLVVADSLFEALFDGPADPMWRERQSRLFATLDEARRRYPEDPEVWYELGDALYHWPVFGRTTPDQILRAFDHAIALDSALGPAYIHPVDVGFILGRPALGKRYLSAFLKLDQTDPNTEGLGLVHDLTEHPPPWPRGIRRHLDTASTYVLVSAWWILRRYPDSAETAIRLAHAIGASRRSGDPVLDDSLVRAWTLTRALLDRGHLREAYAAAGSTFPLEFAQIAVLGAAPAETHAVFARWLADTLGEQVVAGQLSPFEFLSARLLASAWWAPRQDTLSIAEGVRRWEGLARAAGRNTELKRWAEYGAASGRAYAALARRDTAEAVRRFAELPDSVCPCLYDRIMTAHLLSLRGRRSEVAKLLERSAPLRFWDPFDGLWWLERGRLAEALRQPANAIEAYRYVADLWRHADPELQVYVREARAGIARLGPSSAGRPGTRWAPVHGLGATRDPRPHVARSG
jgi:tetratricopeptide (TPR) repeat protein